MTADIINPSPPAWDAFILQHPRGHLLQLTNWGQLKQAYGWEVERVALSRDGQIIAGAQLLFRPLPLNLGSMAYLAMGPCLTAEAENYLPQLWSAIHASARRHHCVFQKWEPGIYSWSEPVPDFAGLRFRTSPQTVQPPRTILIDISGSDESILARMNQGTRRKIRQSEKNAIRYFEGSPADVDSFTQLMQRTGDRNDFGVHEAGYYALAYQLFVPDQGALILAEHEGDILAGVMVFNVGSTAWYLYGASADHKRNLMASYGVQWQAIQWAKTRGCTQYDLWGIPDEDAQQLENQFESRSDGLWGVYGFKRGWGGEIVRSLGAWDHIYNPVLYAGYITALKVRG